MLKSKKAQVGETMTWIVATIVIIGILLIFTFVSSLFAAKEGRIVDLGRIYTNEDLVDVNWLNIKTEIAFGLNQDNKNQINNWIKEVEDE